MTYSNDDGKYYDVILIDLNHGNKMLHNEWIKLFKKFYYL